MIGFPNVEAMAPAADPTPKPIPLARAGYS